MTPRKANQAGAGNTVKLFTLDVLLVEGPVTEEYAEANPVVCRTIQIRGDQTLVDLHYAIYDAFGRDEEHLYEFQIAKKPHDRQAVRYQLPGDGEWMDDADPEHSVTETTIADLGLGEKKSFWYWFDFGDDWWHHIEITHIGEVPARGKFPRLTARVGKNPPQYPEID